MWTANRLPTAQTLARNSPQGIGAVSKGQYHREQRGAYVGHARNKCVCSLYARVFVPSILGPAYTLFGEFVSILLAGVTEEEGHPVFTIVGRRTGSSACNSVDENISRGHEREDETGQHNIMRIRHVHSVTQ